MLSARSATQQRAGSSSSPWEPPRALLPRTQTKSFAAAAWPKSRSIRLQPGACAPGLYSTLQEVPLGGSTALQLALNITVLRSTDRFVRKALYPSRSCCQAESGLELVWFWVCFFFNLVRWIPAQLRANPETASPPRWQKYVNQNICAEKSWPNAGRRRPWQVAVWWLCGVPGAFLDRGCTSGSTMHVVGRNLLAIAR